MAEPTKEVSEHDDMAAPSAGLTQFTTRKREGETVTIYRVRYEEQLDVDGDWSAESLNVAAGDDAQVAVDKARTYSLAQEWDIEDADPPKKGHVVAFRLLSVEAIADVDVE